MASHRRLSTQERIAEAVERASDFLVDPQGPDTEEPSTQEWACLECTFINTSVAKVCAMCFQPNPAAAEQPNIQVEEPQYFPNSEAPTNISNKLYGSVPPPAESQMPKREQPKTQLTAAKHRRMTTEEQIALAIQQSVSTEDIADEEELFQKADQSPVEPTHQRMTTAEQINRAIQMSETGEDGWGHRRLSTEEQIANAINETVVEAPEEEMTDEDRINAAIADMGIDLGITDDSSKGGSGPHRGHLRMSTEEQIKRAITMSSGDDETFSHDNKASFASFRQDQVIQQIIDNPEDYGTFEPPQGIRLDPLALNFVKYILSIMNSKKQEINKLRLLLNTERLTTQELRYEQEILLFKCHKLEEDMQKKDKELEHAIATQNFVEKAVSPEEDTFVTEETTDKPVHRAKEPSYGGIRELFTNPEDITEKKADHAREATYGGIKEMFQSSEPTPAEARDKDGPAQMKKTHEREPSYNGMTELFITRPEKDEPNNWQATQGHEQAKQESRQQKNVGQRHEREPSYGGIRDMFTTPDDRELENATGEEEDESALSDPREMSYGGIRQMFAEEDDDLGLEAENKEENGKDTEHSEISGRGRDNAEELEENQPEALEEIIEASFDVIWNLLVEKVHHPEKYLPVADVAVEHREGKWVRHMYLTPMELVISEEIVVDEQEHVIKFVDNNYPDLEIVNALERTDSPNKQRVVFYKQNRETGIKIVNPQLIQMFTTDVHFLKMRSSQKMSKAAHAREPSYGGVAAFVAGDSHGRNVSYGGVGDIGSTNFTEWQGAQHTSGRHSREMSYGGLRTMFETNDSPQLMAKLQEEVFRVMDSYEWSQITKGMVVKEVEAALGFELKPHHKRFIKVTIMRIIDGKLKLECFAGETVKKEIVQAEQAENAEAEGHKRDISFGGVQTDENNDDWEKKEEEFDELYSRAQEKELDHLYDKAQNYSKSAQAIIGGGFKSTSKIQREREKEIVRKTQRHSRNVSYGGVRYTKEDAATKVLDDIGPEINVVESSGYTEKIDELNEKVVTLTKENVELKQFTDNMRKSKFILVQTCSEEIERLRHIISRLS